MYCTKCGARIEDGATFCTECGAPVEQDGSTATVPDAPTPIGATVMPSPPQQTPSKGGSGARKGIVAAVAAVAAVAVVALVMWQQGIGPFARGTTGTGSQALSAWTTPGSDSSGSGSAGTGSSGSATSGSGSGSSTSSQSVTVPDVTGLSQADATQRLEGAGLGVGTVRDEYSDSVSSGCVISQSVSAGTTAAKGTSVGLVVSKGSRQTSGSSGSSESSSSGGHTYTLVQQAMTWDDAEAYCESRGGHLATITSADEYQRVLSSMSGTGVRVCWVGGHRSGNSWYWVTGEDFSYTAWASGEPNNDGGGENCLALLKTPSDDWGWYDCPADVSSTYKSKYLGFVMEKDN